MNKANQQKEKSPVPRALPAPHQEKTQESVVHTQESGKY